MAPTFSRMLALIIAVSLPFHAASAVCPACRETAAPRSSTLGLPRQTYSTNAKSKWGWDRLFAHRGGDIVVLLGCRIENSSVSMQRCCWRLCPLINALTPSLCWCAPQVRIPETLSLLLAAAVAAAVTDGGGG